MEPAKVNCTDVEPYRILISDDHSVVRRGLRALLASQPSIEVCSEASDGIETIEHVKKHKPNLVILDLTMPVMTGLEVAKTIRQQWPETDVMVLSMHFSDELAREVLRTGALAYVLKSDADKDLLAAVDNVRHHQPFFTGRLAASMMQQFANGAKDKLDDTGSTLTRRESEVLRLLADGQSNKQAAAVLGVSPRTVESHRDHIMRKMGFSNFSELVRFAIRNTLIDT